MVNFLKQLISAPRHKISKESACTEQDFRRKSCDMKSINFLRFENIDGIGMYRISGSPGHELFDFISDHPGFYSDIELKKTFEFIYGNTNFQEFIFGFCDYKQILKWIPFEHLKSTFKNMEAAGVQCTGYSGEVVEGGYQSLIRKETARRGRKIGFETLLKRIEETC